MWLIDIDFWAAKAEILASHQPQLTYLLSAADPLEVTLLLLWLEKVLKSLFLKLRTFLGQHL
jgi:hypothetical protein